MTFSKLSRGGRVCGAGSRGQAEMLRQIYSLWGVRGGWGDGEHGEGATGRAGIHILPKMLPRWLNLNLTRSLLPSSAALLGPQSPLWLLAAGGAGSV